MASKDSTESLLAALCIRVHRTPNLAEGALWIEDCRILLVDAAVSNGDVLTLVAEVVGLPAAA